MEKELKNYLDSQFERLATKDDLDETHSLVSKGFTAIEKKMDKGFTAVEKKMDKMEQRLTVKIDGVRNSLDAEILRRVDDHAELKKRISKLEELHGITYSEPEPQHA